jgi:diaminopimelate decarboxylase
VVTPEVWLTSPQIGDLIVVPVTGAYCFTMVNNYNGALKPPVIYCADGIARLGVRRETQDEWMAREVGLVTAGSRTG